MLRELPRPLIRNAGASRSIGRIRAFWQLPRCRSFSDVSQQSGTLLETGTILAPQEPWQGLSHGAAISNSASQYTTSRILAYRTAWSYARILYLR